MQSKNFALAVLASALLSTTAFAQSSPPPANQTQQSAVQSQATPGQWRASKLVGLDVYNANNEKIGDIDELITDSSGKITTIVLGVGGFLGMGEHRVGLRYDQVKFVNEPVRSSSTSNNGSRTTGTGATSTTTTSSGARDYPDHAMVSMTKDQLKALPAFKYASDTSSNRGTTTTPSSTAPADRPAGSAPAPSNR